MSKMQENGVGRPFKLFYILALAALVFSGFGQMPIFKRYYLADLPGMAWSADYYVTLVIHYLAVAAFLALSTYYVVIRAARRRLWPDNGPAWVRTVIFTVMIATGSVLLARNLPWIHVPPQIIVFATFTHVAGTMTFLIMAATYFRFGKRKKENAG